MEEALKDMPVETFKVPPGITLMKIDLQTGEPPHEGSQEIVLEAFFNPTQADENLGQTTPGPPSKTGLPDAPIDSH
jgi:membrane carboxypeptidase/penicillin-binding protein